MSGRCRLTEGGQRSGGLVSGLQHLEAGVLDEPLRETALGGRGRTGQDLAAFALEHDDPLQSHRLSTHTRMHALVLHRNRGEEPYDATRRQRFTLIRYFV